MKSASTLATTIFSVLPVERHRRLHISKYQLTFTLTLMTALLKYFVRAYFEGFDVDIQPIARSILFHYEHGLSEPKIYNAPPALMPDIRLKATNVLRYGMLEGTAVVDAEYAVYDPQNVSTPELFEQNGSTAKNLALILNRYEATTLSGQPGLSAAEQAIYLFNQGHAQVIIIKQGPAGALVCDNGKISTVPAYETSHVFKIGSGDA